MSAIPLTLLNGFLGAGKTTLLKRLLHQAFTAGRRLAVIANDMSTQDVDRELLISSHLVNQSQRNFISIAGGSIASARLLPTFAQALATLIEEHAPEHILVETSGSTHPWPLIEALSRLPGVRLHGVLALVDSALVLHDYDGGAALVDAFSQQRECGQRGIETLLVEQLMFASQILLTKTDRLPEGALSALGQALSPLNPAASMIGVRWGGVTLESILSLPAYDHLRAAHLARELGVADTAPDPAAYRIGSRTLTDPRPFHPRRLWDAYHQHLGLGIHRSKGFFWLPSRDDEVLVWNQAAGAIGLERLGYWKIAALNDPSLNLSGEERQIMQGKLAPFPPRFGDRRCELTIIGQDAELDTFVAALNAAFCSEAEIADWQAGRPFDDPWPTRSARLH